MDTVVDSKAVNDCLDKIRPYIQHDGGDIELLRFLRRNQRIIA